MATCEKCGNKYFSKECLACKYGVANKKRDNQYIHNEEKTKTHNINYWKNKKHANFLIRFLATLIDTIIISIPITLISKEYIADAIVAIIIISFWIFWNGQTPGKKILNLKIVDENYFNINLKTAIIRYIGYYISILTFFIGFAIIAFRNDKKGLHDILAKTYVIHTDKEKTTYENDTSDKTFAIISIFIGVFLILYLITMYQQTKILNKMMYGTNNEKINKQTTNIFKKLNQNMKF
jgi:uncharacterized RDD family membrane protein YckC